MSKAAAYPQLCLLLLSFGCGGDGPTPPAPPPPPPPPPPTVASVVLNKDTAQLVPQFNVQLAATPKDAAGNTLQKAVTWQSSAPTVASVSSEGLVSGLTVGTAQVTATSDGKTATAAITVLEGAVVGASGGVVTANGGKIEIKIPAGALSASLPISVTPLASPGPGVAPGTAYELGPEGTTFAQPVTLQIRMNITGVDSTLPLYRLSRFTDGKWVPLPGSGTVRPSRTVVAETRSFSRYAIYHPVAPSGGWYSALTITPARGSVFFGQTLLLSSGISEEEAGWYAIARATGPAKSWSGPSEAPVSAAGVVSGLVPGGPYLVHGEARYIVRCEDGPCYLGTYFGTDTVDIMAESISLVHAGVADVVVGLIPVKSITIAGPDAALAAGAKAMLTPTLKDTAGTPLSLEYRTITWASNNASIASVAQTGEVTAVAPGTATISATSDGVTGSLTLTVKGSTTDVATINVDPTLGEVEVGNTLALSVWPRDAAGGNLTGKTVSYESLHPAQATVSADGIVTGVSAGPFQIRVSVEGVQVDHFLTAVPTYPLVNGSPGTGWDHSCLLRAGGTIWCWGNGDYGQRGDGVLSLQQRTPVRVVGAQVYKALSVGGRRSCALTTAGLAYCWGRNFGGQLGDGTTVDRSTPVAVAGGRVYEKIYAAPVGGPGQEFSFSCALEASGSAWCWGHGSFGTATPTQDYLVPTQVVSVPPFTQLAIGRKATGGDALACGLTAAGEVWCFGDNAVPSRAATGHAFTSITAGLGHFCGLKAGGEVWCWGRNFFGQLGDGSTVNRTSPVKVVGGQSFTAVSAGDATTCAIALDQRAWCWGIHGRNGDGSPPRGPTGRQDQSTPVAVHGSRRYLELATAGTTCGRTADGTWCWGETLDNGQMGNTYRYNSPVKVKFP